jgi:hypothetical protein
VSMTMFHSPLLMRIEGRSRVSRGSVDLQTAQPQPMVGTPELVPDPRTVIFSGIFPFCAQRAARVAACALFPFRAQRARLLVTEDAAACALFSFCAQSAALPAEDARRMRYSPTGGFLFDGFLLARFLFSHLYEAKTEFRDGVLQRALLFHREIALGFFLQHCEQIDVVTGQIEIRLLLIAEGQQTQTQLRLKAQ